MSDLQRHAPVRPFWFCAADAQPWPCGRARADLAAEYIDESRFLAMDMADCLGEATRDLCGLYPEPPNPVEMYARFLGWVRHLAINRFRNAERFRSRPDASAEEQ